MILNVSFYVFINIHHFLSHGLDSLSLLDTFTEAILHEVEDFMRRPEVSAIALSWLNPLYVCPFLTVNVNVFNSDFGCKLVVTVVVFLNILARMAVLLPLLLPFRLHVLELFGDLEAVVKFHEPNQEGENCKELGFSEVCLTVFAQFLPRRFDTHSCGNEDA